MDKKALDVYEKNLHKLFVTKTTEKDNGELDIQLQAPEETWEQIHLYALQDLKEGTFSEEDIKKYADAELSRKEQVVQAYLVKALDRLAETELENRNKTILNRVVMGLSITLCGLTGIVLLAIISLWAAGI